MLQDHVIKESCDYMGEEFIMVSHYPEKFGGYRYCGSRDLMVLLVVEQDFSC